MKVFFTHAFKGAEEEGGCCDVDIHIGYLILDGNPFLRFAREQPERYLRMAGHAMVMTELVALLTPCVAVGIQWICALCNDSATTVLLELLSLGSRCVLSGGKECFFDFHCAVRGE